jgi:hypothetical protein
MGRRGLWGDGAYCYIPLLMRDSFFQLWVLGFMTTTCSFSEISTNVRSGLFVVAACKVPCRAELDIPLGVPLVSCMFASA